MPSVSEIPLVSVPSAAEAHGGGDSFEPTFSRWKAMELPQPRRPSPVPLVAFALFAGIAAMLLGGVAVVSAMQRGEEASAPPAAPAKPAATAGVEERVLALLAKPSTDRIVFRGSGGRLFLVVGSAGRAAVVVRGFERAPAAQPHRAWVMRDRRLIRAATFTGRENAVFLSVPVGRKDSVVVASDRAAALRPGSARIVASR